MTDLFWIIVTSNPALWTLAVIAVVAGVVSLLPLRLVPTSIAPYVVLAKVAALTALFVLGLCIGHRLADERAEVARLKSQVEWQRIQMEAQDAAAADAERFRKEAEAKADAANQKVADYEDKLSKQPAGCGCDLDDADVDSLRDIAR
jgi:hypothetical protein